MGAPSALKLPKGEAHRLILDVQRGDAGPRSEFGKFVQGRRAGVEPVPACEPAPALVRTFDVHDGAQGRGIGGADSEGVGGQHGDGDVGGRRRPGTKPKNVERGRGLGAAYVVYEIVFTASANLFENPA